MDYINILKLVKFIIYLYTYLILEFRKGTNYFCFTNYHNLIGHV